MFYYWAWLVGNKIVIVASYGELAYGEVGQMLSTPRDRSRRVVHYGASDVLMTGNAVYSRMADLVVDNNKVGRERFAFEGRASR